MKEIFGPLALSLIMASSTVFAQSTGGAAPAARAATDMVDGEVRKVDKDARKITLRHAEIKKLDMPAMTMVFPVKEPTLLDKVKAGDKVKFKVDTVGGALTVTELELAK